jgi:hypothetical protein
VPFSVISMIVVFMVFIVVFVTVFILSPTNLEVRNDRSANNNIVVIV